MRKREEEVKNRGKNIIAGKHYCNQQYFVWGAIVLSSHHLQSILLTKINSVKELVMVCFTWPVDTNYGKKLSGDKEKNV